LRSLKHGFDAARETEAEGPGRAGPGVAVAEYRQIMSMFYEITPKIVEAAFKKLLSGRCCQFVVL
jgi:hypothetical protein